MHEGSYCGVEKAAPSCTCVHVHVHVSIDSTARLVSTQGGVRVYISAWIHLHVRTRASCTYGCARLLGAHVSAREIEYAWRLYRMCAHEWMHARMCEHTHSTYARACVGALVHMLGGCRYRSTLPPWEPSAFMV